MLLSVQQLGEEAERLSTHHMLTMPSQPPVAKVPCCRLKAMELTGKTTSRSPSFRLWHLKAYFRCCTASLLSKYSTATLQPALCGSECLHDLGALPASAVGARRCR